MFVGSDDGKIYALNLATGKKVWEFKTGGPVESSALVLDGKVFVGSSDAGEGIAGGDIGIIWIKDVALTWFGETPFIC